MTFSTETEGGRSSLGTRAAAPAALPEIPPDVAILYAWANLSSARYRDFSAARREARAHARERAAMVKAQFERHARVAAEQLACEREEAAQKAELQARHHDALAWCASGEGRAADCEAHKQAWGSAMLQAERLLLLAAQSRVEAEVHEHAEAAARAVAHRENREGAEAHASSLRQTFRYETNTQGSSSTFHVLRGRAFQERDRVAQMQHPGERNGELQAVMNPERFPSRRRSQPVTLDAERLTAAPTGATPEARIAAQGASLDQGVVGVFLISENLAGGAGELQMAASKGDAVPPLPAGEISADEPASIHPTLLREQGGAVPAWLHGHVGVPGSVHDPAPQRIKDAQLGNLTARDIAATNTSRWQAHRSCSTPDRAPAGMALAPAASAKPNELRLGAGAPVNTVGEPSSPYHDRCDE